MQGPLTTINDMTTPTTPTEAKPHHMTLPAYREHLREKMAERYRAPFAGHEWRVVEHRKLGEDQHEVSVCGTLLHRHAFVLQAVDDHSLYVVAGKNEALNWANVVNPEFIAQAINRRDYYRSAQQAHRQRLRADAAARKEEAVRDFGSAFVVDDRPRSDSLRDIPFSQLERTATYADRRGKSTAAFN